MATVKLGLKGLSATETVAYAQGLHDAVLANVATFATPTPTMAALQQAIDDLAAANAAVEANRGRLEYKARREALVELRELVKQLAGYVQMASGGDPAIIGLSSFAVVKRGSRIGELDPPVNLGSRPTSLSGRVALKWKPEKGADLYHVYMSATNDPFTWELIGVTTKSSFDADTLAPLRFYWFAVTAIGAAGETSKSEPALCLAAA